MNKEHLAQARLGPAKSLRECLSLSCHVRGLLRAPWALETSQSSLRSAMTFRLPQHRIT